MASVRDRETLTAEGRGSTFETEAAAATQGDAVSTTSGRADEQIAAVVSESEKGPVDATGGTDTRIRDAQARRYVRYDAADAICALRQR